MAATRATRIAEQAARREEFEAARAARDADKAHQRVKDAGAAVEEAQEALAAAEREAADADKTRDTANARVKRARAELAGMQEREEKARRAGSLNPTADPPTGRPPTPDRRLDRQVHGEAGAEAAPIALRLDTPAVQLDDVADDREAETEPAVRPRDRGVALREPVEDERQQFRLECLHRCR